MDETPVDYHSPEKVSHRRQPKSAELRSGEVENQAGTGASPRSSLLLSPSPWLSASKIAPRLHHGLSQTSRPVACFISVMAWVSTQRPHAIPAWRGAAASYCIGLRLLHLRHQKKKALGVSRITVWVKADGSAQRMSLCSKNDIQKKATNRGKLSFCFPETFDFRLPRRHYICKSCKGHAEWNSMILEGGSRSNFLSQGRNVRIENSKKKARSRKWKQTRNCSPLLLLLARPIYIVTYSKLTFHPRCLSLTSPMDPDPNATRRRVLNASYP